MMKQYGKRTVLFLLAAVMLCASLFGLIPRIASADGEDEIAQRTVRVRVSDTLTVLVSGVFSENAEASFASEDPTETLENVLFCHRLAVTDARGEVQSEVRVQMVGEAVLRLTDAVLLVGETDRETPFSVSKTSDGSAKLTFRLDCPARVTFVGKAEAEAAAEPAAEPVAEPVESTAVPTEEPTAAPTAAPTSAPDMDGEGINAITVQSVHTYEFYLPSDSDPSGWTRYDTQYVAAGRAVTEPAAPTADGRLVFRGWYLSEDENAGRFSFPAPAETAASVEGDPVTALYGRFDAQCTVTFYAPIDAENLEAGSKIVDSKTIAGTLSTVGVSYAQPTGFLLAGWERSETAANDKTLHGGAPEIAAEAETDIVLDGALSLYAVLLAGYTVDFDTNGGTIIASQQVESNTCAVRPEDPIKDGYAFLGWYTDAAMTQAFDFNTVLTLEAMETLDAGGDGHFTLFARWTVADAVYTVVYWKENVNGTFSQLYKQTRSAVTGSTVDRAAILNSNYQNRAWSDSGDTEQAYYEADASKSEASVTVRGSGTTVANVYFVRKTYTLRFRTTQSGRRIVVNGVITAISGNSYYSFTAKLGESIADRWPSVDPISTGGIFGAFSEYFTGWDCKTTGFEFYNCPQTLHSVLLGSGTNGTLSFDAAYSRTSRSYTLKSYYMDINGQYPAQPIEEEIRASGWDNFWNNGVDLTASGTYGFTVAEQTSSYNNYAIYYARNTHAITLYDGSQQLYRNDAVYYEQPLSGLDIPYTVFGPAHPANVDAAYYGDYTFEGWYTTPEFYGDPFDFTDPVNAAMPNYNITLYAKWSVKKHTVTLFADEQTQLAQFTATYRNALMHLWPFVDANGEEIVETLRVVRDGRVYRYEFYNWLDADLKVFAEGHENEAPIAQYVFSGWFDEQNRPLTLSQTVDSDKRYFARWTSEEQLCTLTYKRSDGADTETYSVGATAVIQNGGTANFLYWSAQPDGSGARYDAGERVTLNGDLELYPVVAEARTQVALCYAGLGSGTPAWHFGEGGSVDTNSPVVLWDAAHPETQKANAKLIGWAKTPDAKEPDYALGEHVRIDETDAQQDANGVYVTTLYAVYRTNVLAPTGVKTDDAPYFAIVAIGMAACLAIVAARVLRRKEDAE